MQIKNQIDLKSQQIIAKSRNQIDAPKPMIFTHKITIRESINPQTGNQKTDYLNENQSQEFLSKRILENEKQDEKQEKV